MAKLQRPKRPPAYERRLILFIDFLGFKEVVETTADDPAALARLIAALNDIGRLGDASIFDSQRVTQLSDSVVMSYRVTEQSGVFWMINAIALTVISLAQRGFLLRGALTVGDLYHRGRHVVGPAMVRAYELESKVAKFPRVIVEPEVVALARASRKVGHSADEEEKYVRSFIHEDADGHLFIDYVSWEAVVEVAGADDEGYPAYLGTLAELLRIGLAHRDLGVVEKYLWLHPRYLAAVDLVRDLPDDSPYRAANPENCSYIEDLPRLTALAQTARRRVKRDQAKRAASAS